MTLADVAGLAGVSVATVSRSLRGDPQISPATQERVRQIADELTYVPNVTARNLVLQSSASLGIMTPDVTDPIHGQLVTGFQQRAAEHGYSVVLSNGFWDAATERRAFREFASHRVAGVTVMGSVLPQAEVRRLLSPSPVLLIGTEHSPPNGKLDLPRGCLRPDDLDGMRQVVAHLVERGYRTVAYVSISSGAGHVVRCEALFQAMSERRLPKPVILRADEAGGVAAVADALVRRRRDVAVCYDDKTALTLMDELRSSGLAVPDDIGIVGFDDIPFARISNPRLTTVSQSSDDVGRRCVDVLLAAVESGRLPKSHSMPVSLVVRETTPGPTSNQEDAHAPTVHPIPARRGIRRSPELPRR